MAEASNQPLVSIIMPAHNAALFIGDAIRTVLAQTYTNWELLVIDDASTDGTGEIVQSFPDERIRYFPVERIGSPSGVRNVGLKNTQGELIAFLDADDLYYPDSLEKLARPLLEHPEYTAAFGFAQYMDENGIDLPNPMQLLENGDGTYALPATYRKEWKEIVAGTVNCLLAALMLRKSTQERIGYFDETLCGPEDYHFYLRIYLDNFEGFHCLPDYIYRYRIHSASLTKSPEHLHRVLSSSLRIMDWLYTEADIPAEVRPYRSNSYTEVYRYLARERILNNQPALGREIVLQGFRNPYLQKIHWLQKCFPLLLRSFLPHQFDRFLVELRWVVSNRLLTGKLLPALN